MSPTSTNTEIFVTGGLAAPPQTGTITVNSNLPGATFSLKPPVSGAPTGGPYPVTITNAPVGLYGITFNPVQGYVIPSPPSQTLTAGGTISFNGQYVASPPLTGTITVNSNLPNATFRLSPAVSGAPAVGPYPVTVSNAPVGLYSITFNAVSGYTTPSPPSQTLTAGGTISFNGQYVAVAPETGTITINSNLPSATFVLEHRQVGRRSQPPVSGGGPYPVTVSNAAPGQYTIAFSDVQGYVTPSLAEQTLVGGGTISFNGQYVLTATPPQNTILFDETGVVSNQSLTNNIPGQPATYPYTDSQGLAHTYHVFAVADNGLANPAFQLSLQHEGSGSRLTLTAPSGGDIADTKSGGALQFLIPFGLSVNAVDGVNASFGSTVNPGQNAFECAFGTITGWALGYALGSYATGFDLVQCTGLLSVPQAGDLCSVIYPIINNQAAACLADPKNNSLFGDKVLNTHQIRNIRWKPTQNGFPQTLIQLHLDQPPAQVITMIQQKGVTVYVNTPRGDFWLDNFR